jgi:hypothetical protein
MPMAWFARDAGCVRDWPIPTITREQRNSLAPALSVKPNFRTRHESAHPFKTRTGDLNAPGVPLDCDWRRMTARGLGNCIPARQKSRQPVNSRRRPSQIQRFCGKTERRFGKSLGSTSVLLRSRARHTRSAEADFARRVWLAACHGE